LRAIPELGQARVELCDLLCRQVAHHDAIVRRLALQRGQHGLALRLHQLELAPPLAFDIGERFGGFVENPVN
jgi:hypothetical protein